MIRKRRKGHDIHEPLGVDQEIFVNELLQKFGFIADLPALADLMGVSVGRLRGYVISGAGQAAAAKYAQGTREAALSIPFDELGLPTPPLSGGGSSSSFDRPSIARGADLSAKLDPDSVSVKKVHGRWTRNDADLAKGQWRPDARTRQWLRDAGIPQEEWPTNFAPLQKVPAVLEQNQGGPGFKLSLKRERPAKNQSRVASKLQRGFGRADD